MKAIRPRELEALLEADKPVEIVDIRPIDEFENAHIEGAHSIPSAGLSVEAIFCERELLPTEPLYLVSENGGLARRRACDLEREGLDNLVVLVGGMNAWRGDGLPVVQHRTISDWLDERREEVAALTLAV